jgi:endonuclease/exonuclease/phosphatase family metal-dependent hydrolase
MMKIRNISLAILLLLLFACGSNTSFQPDDPEDELQSFGSLETLEVMTWNLENFAKNGDLTVQYVSALLDSLEVDIIALQEIENPTKFSQLYNSLPQWNGYLSTGAAYDINLAFLYRQNLQPEFYQILTDDWYAFPRSPLVMEVTVDGYDLMIINNHFKAGGDSDDEERRRQASENLKLFLDENYPSTALIVLGDLNDQLTDPPQQNVFSIFLEDQGNYLFTDYQLEVAGVDNYSYPSWPSHLDHVLISDELYTAFLQEKSEVQTLQVDQYFESWSEYETNVSDHLPVAVKLYLLDE